LFFKNIKNKPKKEDKLCGVENPLPTIFKLSIMAQKKKNGL